jgi:hypothetical protein
LFNGELQGISSAETADESELVKTAERLFEELGDATHLAFSFEQCEWQYVAQFERLKG